ncbi:hypothetical protein HF086_002143 [Spodoptera exigua]|uniref:Uncharacterized protein n=1 Tax=Spodoptera exigua TaxID=7107 RepID=A0A922SJI4_SPOEX|nr:hypothetical protein HF086_002143 [Spodoptera exigua]
MAFYNNSAEYNPRAVQDDISSDNHSLKKSSPRADSSGSEDRDHERDRPKKDDSSKEQAKAAKSSNESDDDEDEKNTCNVLIILF